MSVSEFQSQYLSEQPLLWLALALALGILIGIWIGRRLERARGGRRASPIEVPADSSELETAVPAESTVESIAEPEPETTGFRISDLVGIDAKQVKALAAHGISGVAELREATQTKAAREQLADDLQLEDFVVNKWARMADFLRFGDMTPEVAEFLVFAGIHSTKDLASRNPESVAHKLQNLNEKESRIDAVPTRQQIEAWVALLND